MVAEYRQDNNASDECMINRRGEKGGTFFRSDRYYKIDGLFFFSTREGAEIGPYEKRDDAEAGLERYITSIQSGDSLVAAKKIALSGNWALTNFQ